jgi:TP901 family phage tail tape measure protein
MTNRTTKVTLVAQVSGYLEGMDKAAKKTKELGEGAGDAAKKMDATRVALGTVGTGFTLVGAVATAAVAIAVAKMAQFESAISSVKAATQESAENMGLLREAALEAGARTSFSATEAANAVEELGKAGLSTEAVLSGGLDGALSLAAAGNLGVAEAAGIAAIAMKQFKLEGDQIPHVADLLAAGAGKAVGDVADLGAALGQAGLVAAGAGFKIEETTGVLAAFADAGLLGSDAGTSLKTAIIALQNPSAKAAAELEKYTISVYNADGSMKGFSEIAGELNSSLSDQTDETRNAALATIFGTDALRAANVLYTEGADGIKRYVDQTNDAGYAAKVAADRMNNLAGDVEKLGGSLDTALIKSGSGANDVLRNLTQSATVLVDGFGNLPQPVLDASLALTAVVGGIGLTGGAALTAIPKIAEMRSALDVLGISGKGVALKAVAMGGAIGLATIAISYFVDRAATAAATTAELTGSLDENTGAMTKYTREIVAKKLAESDAFAATKELGYTQAEVTDIVLKGGDALDKLKSKLAGRNNIVDFFNRSGIAAGNAKMEIDQMATNVEHSKKKFEDQSEAMEGATESTDTAAQAYSDAADQAQGLTDNLLSLIDTVNASNTAGQDAISTNSAYQSTLAEVAAYVAQAQAGVEGFALGFDKNTAAGAANQAMLAGLAGDAQAAAQAQLELDGKTTNYIATLAGSNQKIYETAIALGATEAEARGLADSVAAIPDQKTVQILAETAAANTALDGVLGRMRLLNGTTVRVAVGPGGGGGQVPGAATGGAIVGPGGPTSDAAGLFRLSNGEHVLDAMDVIKMGGQAGVYAFRESLYSRQGYAAGGAVQYATAAPYAVAAGVTGASDRPIMMDGNLFGMLRTMANGEAQIVVNAYDRGNSLSDRMGRQI